MKILITGATGLVGSACVDLFLKKGWEVIGLDNNMRSKFFGTPDKYIQNPIDIRDQDTVEQGFKDFGPFDAIIHAAAQPSHDYSRDHVLEDFAINAQGTLLLLEATRKYSPQATFVYVSSDKVYGENMHADFYIQNLIELPTRFDAKYPFDEYLGLDFAGKRSPFGVSKTAADLYVQEYAAEGWLTTGIFRPGCITGKNHEGAELHGFLAYLTKCIKEGIPYKIFGFKGKQVRDQIHASDLASAFWHFIQSPHSGEVYNMGGGPERSVSILEAGELISKKLNKPFLYEILHERPGDRIWDIHDTSKFTSDYPGWKQHYSLDEIIQDVCEK